MLGGSDGVLFWLTARAVASSLLGLPSACGADGDIPASHDVERDCGMRWGWAGRLLSSCLEAGCANLFHGTLWHRCWGSSRLQVEFHFGLCDGQDCGIHDCLTFGLGRAHGCLFWHVECLFYVQFRARHACVLVLACAHVNIVEEGEDVHCPNSNTEFLILIMWSLWISQRKRSPGPCKSTGQKQQKSCQLPEVCGRTGGDNSWVRNFRQGWTESCS